MALNPPPAKVEKERGRPIAFSLRSLFKNCRCHRRFADDRFDRQAVQGSDGEKPHCRQLARGRGLDREPAAFDPPEMAFTLEVAGFGEVFFAGCLCRERESLNGPSAQL